MRVLRRSLWGAVLLFVLLNCGLLRGLQQVREGVEFYATELPQTLQAQQPTLEQALSTAQAELADMGQATPPPSPTTPPSSVQEEGPSLAFRPDERFAITGEFDTLRERLAYIQTIGDQAYTLFEWVREVDRTRNVEAFYWTWGAGDRPASRFVRVGNQVYVEQGGTWVLSQVPEGTLEPMMQPISFEEPLQKVGEEVIAGVPTVHYRWEGPPIPFGTPQDLSLPPGAPAIVGETHTGTAVDVWVTRDNQQLLRLHLRLLQQLTLVDGQQVSGAREVLYEVQAINQPVDIPAIEELTAGAPKPPIPLPQEAQVTNQISQPPMWGINVPSWDLNQAVDYFQNQLPSQGYTVEAVYVSESSVVFRVTDPQGRVWEVSMTPGLSGPGVDVVIRAAGP